MKSQDPNHNIDVTIAGDTETERVTKLIQDLVAVGCTAIALGETYCLEEPDDVTRASKAHSILRAFGPRDHLQSNIVGYLRSIDRVFDWPTEFRPQRTINEYSKESRSGNRTLAD